MTDWGVTIVPIIDPLDLTILSGSSSPAPSPGQTVTKGSIICHELERVEYHGIFMLFLLLTYY